MAIKAPQLLCIYSNKPSELLILLITKYASVVTFDVVVLILGTRFRPLSLDIPKPLFPIAGVPLIQHHIEACSALKDLKEILIIGFYPAAQIQKFVTDMQHQYNIHIRYGVENHTHI